MIRHVIIFLIAAGIGGVVTLGIRSAWHRPYASPTMPDATNPAPVTPSTPTPKPTPAPTSDPHAGHTADSAKMPVNSVCAICGMDVDPKLTATYRDQVIGFGCPKCPTKFAKEPERFGPYFLRNEEAP